MYNYCRNYVANDMSKQDAYKASYNAENMNNKTISVEIAELTKDPRISLEIARMRESINYTVLDHIKELEIGQHLAKEEKQFATYVKATELKGKVKGLYVERSKLESTVTIKDTPVLDRLKLLVEDNEKSTT